jgi:tyrosinase
MTTSRRDVLLQGAVIGAGVIASSVPGMQALAQAQPPERRSLQGLAWNDPIVATYRDAVGKMKQMADSEKFSWASLAGIHGVDPDTYHFCPHGNWYFLPWHRAYVLTYERIIRNLTGNNDFAMPYWDWTANPKMPEVFLQPTTPDGKKNWLYVDDQAFGKTWKRTWPPQQPMPDRQVGPAVLKAILDATEYEEFGTSRPSGQNNLDQSWIVAEDAGDQGILEARPHNLTHNNIGGWMPTALSPRDPIFFMHHCNIDRIWAVWNSLGNPNSSDPLWTDMTFENNFYNVDGTYYSPKVSDLYVPETLGYTYGLGTPVEAVSPPSVVALHSKLKTLRAAPGASSPGVKSFTAAPPPRATATATRPLDIAVNVDPELLQAVARRKAPGSGTELLNFALARQQRATGPRAFAFIRDVAVTQSERTEYQIFLDRGDLPAQVPVTDPHYVGSFGIFVHGSHSGRAASHAKPSFAVDLTDAIQRVYGSAPPTGGRIKLRILPVPSGSNVPRVGTATPSRR